MNDFMTPDISMMTGRAAQAQIERASKTAQNTKMNAKQLEKIEKTAEEFEAVFVTEMLKPMFEGIETDGQFGGGKGEEIFRGFMLKEYGQMMAASGTIGIADNIKASMIQMQEAQQNMNTPQNDTYEKTTKIVR